MRLDFGFWLEGLTEFGYLPFVIVRGGQAVFGVYYFALKNPRLLTKFR